MQKDFSTDDAKKIVLDKLRAGWSISRACDYVGVSVKTYEYWLYRAKDPKDRQWFRDEVARIRQKQAMEAPPGVPDFETFSREYMGNRLFEHHLQWLDLLEGNEPRSVHPSQTYIPGHKNLLLINTPPHHAKSELFCQNYVTWRIVQDPNVRVLLVSASADRAKKNLDGIKNRLDKDVMVYRELKDHFAPAEGYNSPNAKWTADMILVNPAIRPRNTSGHPTVQALGIRKKIYGARADLIILDDCADLDNAHEFQKQIEWIQAIINSRLEPGTGKLIIVGTRLAAQDLYSEIRKPEWYISGESPWTYLSQPAVLEMTDDPETWKTLWPRTNVAPAGLDVHEPDADGLYPMWNGPACRPRCGPGFTCRPRSASPRRSLRQRLMVAPTVDVSPGQSLADSLDIDLRVWLDSTLLLDSILRLPTIRQWLWLGQTYPPDGAICLMCGTNTGLCRHRPRQ
jgi:hypothetical protein